jgi:hypothetical protein
MEVTLTCLISSFCVRVRVREKVTHAVIHVNLNAHQHCTVYQIRILIRSNEDILKKTWISCTCCVATRSMWSVFACLLRPPSAHKHNTHEQVVPVLLHACIMTLTITDNSQLIAKLVTKSRGLASVAWPV